MCLNAAAQEAFSVACWGHCSALIWQLGRQTRCCTSGGFDYTVIFLFLSSTVVASPCVPVEGTKKAEHLPFHSRLGMTSTGISNGVGPGAWVPKLAYN